MMTRKVLVLEDEENIRAFVVINLKRAGYEVVQAGSGEEALEKISGKHRCRGVHFDVMLPGIDGYECAARCAARVRGRHHHADRPHAGIRQGHRSDDRRG